MKKFLIVLLLVISALANAQSPGEKADDLIQAAIPNNEHGVAVLVANSDEVVYEKYHGFADVANSRKVDSNTIFRIGSVTKQFTAIAILKLAEQGKLNVNDKLSQYIPDFPKGDHVTIHHLLTHTSGIISFTDQNNFLREVSQPIKTADLINRIKVYGYEFEPGEKWKYNNSAYYILSYLIENVSGMSYSDYLQKYLLEPAGMKNSGVYYNAEKYENEALGYSNVGPEMKRALNWDMSWAGGAGNMYSTVGDLHNWNQSLFNGKIITKNSLEQALSPVKLNDGSNYPYGYGLLLSEYKGLEKIWHNGGLNGFLSALTYYPETDASVVVLSNAYPPLQLVPDVITQRLTDIFFSDKIQLPKEQKLEVEELQQYVGEFAYPSARMKTRVKDGQLYAQLTGQPEFPIFYKGDHTFFWKVVDAQIQFKHDEQGNVIAAMHKQNGMELEVKKVEESDNDYNVSSAEFVVYAGEYDMSGKWLKVWDEDGIFYTQIEGQPKFELIPVEEHKFKINYPIVKVTFEVEGGQATALTIFQNGKTFKASKK